MLESFLHLKTHFVMFSLVFCSFGDEACSHYCCHLCVFQWNNTSCSVPLLWVRPYFVWHLLVNLFCFSYFQISDSRDLLFLQNHFGKSGGEISRKNNKGVLYRPWTKWKVLRAISSTLRFQFTVKCWKVDFLTSSKTRSCESSREKFRMARALLPDTPRPPQFQAELQFFHFLWKTLFFQVH